MARPSRPELRDELVLLAADEFARVGYERASLDRIAAHAHVTKGAVYLHFRGKLELFVTALEQLEQRRDAALANSIPKEPTDELAELRTVLEERLRFHLAHQQLYRLLSILSTELRDEPTAAVHGGTRDEHRTLRAQLRQLLQAGARRGQIDLTDPAAEAFRLAACLIGTCSQYVAAPDDVGLFLETNMLVDGWLAPLARRGKRRNTSRAPSDPQPSPRDDGDFQPAF